MALQYLPCFDILQGITITTYLEVLLKKETLDKNQRSALPLQENCYLYRTIVNWFNTGWSVKKPF